MGPLLLEPEVIMMSLTMVVCFVGGGEGVTVVETLKSSTVVMLSSIVSGALVVIRGRA